MTISDRDALTALHQAYAAAVRLGPDAGAEPWAATWTDDAVWVLPGRHVQGKADIMSTWQTSMRKYLHVVQLYMSATFDIDGDTASGVVQVMEMVRAVDGSSSSLSGHYADTYARTAAGWRFSSRELTVYYRGAPDLSGTFT